MPSLEDPTDLIQLARLAILLGRLSQTNKATDWISGLILIS